MNILKRSPKFRHSIANRAFAISSNIHTLVIPYSTNTIFPITSLSRAFFPKKYIHDESWPANTSALYVCACFRNSKHVPQTENLRVVGAKIPVENRRFVDHETTRHTPYRPAGDTTLTIVHNEATRQAYDQGRHLRWKRDIVCPEPIVRPDRRFPVYSIVLWNVQISDR